MKSATNLFLIFVTALSLNAKADNNLTLKLNLEPKTGYSCSMDMNQSIIQAVNGENQELKQGMLMEWDIDIVGRSKSGSADVIFTYKRIKMVQDFAGQSTEYDSDNPPQVIDQSMKGLAALPGSSINYTLSPDGKVTHLQGADDLVDKMVTALNLPENPQKEKVISDLRKQFGADAIKQMVEQMIGFYPSKPVAVGETWNKEVTITSGLPMHLNSQYQLKSIDGNAAVIDISSQINADSSTSKVTTGPLVMAYNFSGTQTGSIKADTATGLPISSELNQEFSGSVEVSGIPDQEPQSAPLSVSGSVIVTFTKK
jgi:predicted secreted protein